MVGCCYLFNRRMKRPPCCDKSYVKRGLWTAEEDAKILAYVSAHGTGNWTVVPKKAGLNRCGKSCRLRWTNYLRPELKHDGFSAEEEQLIISLHKAIGSRWSLIAQQLPGRTDNDVKNYWNTKLKKKLSKMGIDPLTHKPLSQIISEIGNIRGSSRSLNLVLIPASLSPVPPEISCIARNSDLVGERIHQDFSSLRSYPSWESNGGQNQETLHLQPHLLSEVTSSCSSSSSLTGFLTFDSSPDLLPFGHSPFGWITQRPALLDCVFPKDNGRFPIIPSSSSSVPNSTLNSSLCRGNEAQSAFDNYSEGCSPSSEPSFVEAILESDSKMRSEFPQFLDGLLDY